eukprot:scaffold443_cov527-Prasinococcus_capsulatus_cf.AAC.4
MECLVCPFTVLRKEHGYGIFTSKEGGKYVGQWANGLRHGRGISYPPGTVQMEGGPATPRSKKKSSKEVGSDKGGTPRGIAVGSSALDTSAETSTSHGFETEGTYSGNESADERKTNASRGDGSSGGEDAGSTRNVPEFVSLRDYEDGKLVSDSKHHLEKLSSGRMSLRKKKGKGRVRVEQGEQIFKGHRSYDLMICLQTGLQHTITKHSREVKSKLTEDDFVAKNGVLFPRKGSTSTPPHTTGDFIWKDYSPAVFTKLREYWGLDAGATLRSICGGQGLREFGTPGKSSSVFYVSHDNRFIIKTMRKFEMKALLEMLPKYYQHCTSHESTLLTKFFGLHRVTPKGGRKVRFVVMGNLFNTSLRIHKRFDLKGSTLGREVGAKKKQSELTVYKDNDLDYTFKMESGWRDKLVYQVQKDCKFLEEANVMDYSLLLGVHFRDKAKEENGDANGLDKESVETCIDLSAIQDPILRDHLMVAHKSMAISTLASQNSDLSHRDGSDQLESLASSTRPRRTHTLRPVFGGPGGTDFLSHMFGKSKVELGVNMAATGIPRSQAGAASALSDTENDDVPNELKSGAKDVVLYMGIIDILQEYTITKQLENAYKTVRFNRESISSVDPTYYSQRFQAFFRARGRGKSFVLPHVVRLHLVTCPLCGPVDEKWPPEQKACERD